MESERITIRIPKELMRAAEAKAAEAGKSVGDWARGLMEEATGVKVQMKRGLAGVGERRRKKIARNAIETRWAKK